MGAAPAPAMRPTIGTSARLPGATDLGKTHIVENGEDLLRHLRPARRRQIRGGIAQDSARRHPARRSAEYPAATASADAPAARAPAPCADRPRSRRLARSARSRRRRPPKAKAARDAALRRAPVAAATPEHSRRAIFAGAAAGAVRRIGVDRRLAKAPNFFAAIVCPRRGTVRAARAPDRTSSPPAACVRPSAPQMISRSAARVMAT